MSLFFFHPENSVRAVLRTMAACLMLLCPDCAWSQTDYWFLENSSNVILYDNTEAVSPNSDGSYDISNAAQLSYVLQKLPRTGVTSVVINLQNDIDMGAHLWAPGRRDMLSVTINGNGDFLDNIHFGENTNYQVGLIKYTGTLNVSNLYMEIYATPDHLTGATGFLSVSASNVILDEVYVNLYCDVHIERTEGTGGLGRFGGMVAEINNSSTVSNCTFSGNDHKIYATQTNPAIYAGGLFSGIRGSASLTDCYVQDLEMTGAHFVGGIVCDYTNGGDSGKKLVMNNCDASYLTLTATRDYDGTRINDDQALVGGILGAFYSQNWHGLERLDMTDCDISNATLTGGSGVAGIFGNSCRSSGIINLTNCNASNLTIFADNCSGGLVGNHNKLQNNIKSETYFTNCHVRNSTISGKGYSMAGFIGTAGNVSFQSCTLRNSTVENGTDTELEESQRRYCGGLAGNVSYSSTFTNCSVGDGTYPVTIKGSSWYTGGLVAGSGEETCTITDCIVHTNVSLTSESGNVGGLAGATGVITVKNSEVRSDVVGTGALGGLVGHASGAVTFQNSRTTANVLGTLSSIGGLLGDTSSSTTTFNSTLSIDADCSMSDITVRGSYNTGGMVGFSHEKTVFEDGTHVTNLTIESVFHNNAYHPTGVGGLIGRVDNELTMTGCYLNGTTDISSYVSYTGGLVGSSQADATLERCYVDGTLNLYKDNADINIGSYGGLVGGHDSNNTLMTITDCYANNITLYANADMGGIIGYAPGVILSGCSVENASFTSDVNTYSRYNTGGIVGNMGAKSSVSDCHLKGTVSYHIASGGDNTGGIVGYAGNSGNITGCTVGKEVTIGARSDIGGIVGKVNNTGTTAILVADCTFDGTITAESGNVIGGIAGQTTNTRIENCVVSSDANLNTVSRNDVGGIVGQSNIGTAVSGCESYATIVGGNWVGGIVGYCNNGLVTIENSHAKECAITGTNNVGGIVGGNENIGNNATIVITDCHPYNSTITATNERAGGLIGKSRAKTTITNCVVEDMYVQAKNNASGGVGVIEQNALTLNDCAVIGNTTVEATNIYASGLVGMASYNSYVYTNGTVEGSTAAKRYIPIRLTNCHVGDGVNNVIVKAGYYAGGLCYNPTDTLWMTDCYLDKAQVLLTTNNGNGTLGGIIGDNQAVSYLNRVYVKGESLISSTQGTNYVGGFIGKNRAPIDLTDCYVGDGSNLVTIKGGTYTGGIIGQILDNAGTLIDHCHVSGVSIAGVNTNKNSIGGFVGFRSNAPLTITDSYLGNGTVGTRIGDRYNIDGTIADKTNGSYQYIGGLLGQAGSTAEGHIYNCRIYDDVNIIGSTNIGGVIGYSISPNLVYNTHFSGNIMATAAAGGIIGNNSATVGKSTVRRCSNTGLLVANANVGGIIGSLFQAAGVDILDCWNEGRVYNLTTSTYAGGIIGFANTTNANNTLIAYCYNKGTVARVTSKTNLTPVATRNGIGLLNGDNSKVLRCYNAAQPLIAGEAPMFVTLRNGAASQNCYQLFTDGSYSDGDELSNATLLDQTCFDNGRAAFLLSMAEAEETMDDNAGNYGHFIQKLGTDNQPRLVPMNYDRENDEWNIDESDHPGQYVVYQGALDFAADDGSDTKVDNMVNQAMTTATTNYDFCNIGGQSYLPHGGTPDSELALAGNGQNNYLKYVVGALGPNLSWDGAPNNFHKPAWLDESTVKYTEDPYAAYRIELNDANYYSGSSTFTGSVAYNLYAPKDITVSKAPTLVRNISCKPQNDDFEYQTMALVYMPFDVAKVVIDGETFTAKSDNKALFVSEDETATLEFDDFSGLTGNPQYGSDLTLNFQAAAATEGVVPSGSYLLVYNGENTAAETKSFTFYGVDGGKIYQTLTNINGESVLAAGADNIISKNGNDDYYIAGFAQRHVINGPEWNYYLWLSNDKEDTNKLIFRQLETPGGGSSSAFRAYIYIYGMEFKHAPAQAKLTHSDWNDDINGNETTAISQLADSDTPQLVDVFNLQGQKVKTQVHPKDALSGLPAGIYIINNKKYNRK